MVVMIYKVMMIYERFGFAFECDFSFDMGALKKILSNGGFNNEIDEYKVGHN